MTLYTDVLSYAAGGSPSSISVTQTGAGVQPSSVVTDYLTAELEILIDGTPPTKVNIAWKEPDEEWGTAQFNSGSHGTGWYSGPTGIRLLHDWLTGTIMPEGIRPILTQWITGAGPHPGWDNLRGQASLDGTPAGHPVLLAARQAALSIYLKDRFDTVDNYMGVGVSNGSSALGYCIAHYGLFYDLGAVFRKVVLCSGPPHCCIKKGCTTAGYFYNHPDTFLSTDQADAVDDAWGYEPLTLYSNRVINLPGGPMTRVDAACDPVSFGAEFGWDFNSVDIGANYSQFPGTKLYAIHGGQDMTPAPRHMMDWVEFLKDEHNYELPLRLAANAKHGLQSDALGRELTHLALMDRFPPFVRQMGSFTTITEDGGAFSNSFTATLPYRRTATL